MSTNQVSPAAPWIGVDGTLPLPWLSLAFEQSLAHQGHALLLHGPPGVGQFELAMVLAQSWLCEARPAAGQAACGRCEACHLMQAGAHPDLMVLVPEALRASLGQSVLVEEGEGAGPSGKKLPAGGREIRVSDIRKAIDWGHQTSSRGRGKALVIFPAQALNRVAANALLKTLEEPAGSLRLVLSTFDVQALLPTLRSRCQMVRLPTPDAAIAQSWLREQGLEAPQTLWAAAGGQPQEALALWRDGLDSRLWPELPGAVRQGRADVFMGLPVARVVDALQKVCIDLMSSVYGAPAQYFPQESLPAGAKAEALSAWWRHLQSTARHEDHPWNAALLIESLVLQGRQCWPSREHKKPHVR